MSRYAGKLEFSMNFLEFGMRVWLQNLVFDIAPDRSKGPFSDVRHVAAWKLGGEEQHQQRSLSELKVGRVELSDFINHLSSDQLGLLGWTLPLLLCLFLGGYSLDLPPQ